MKLFRHIEYDEPIVPAVRMTQRSKYTSRAAQEYLAWKQAIGYTFKEGMRRLGHDEPFDCPVEVSLVVCTLEPPAGDIDNLLKAVLDAANKIVWLDDKQVRRVVVDLGPRISHEVGDEWSFAVVERIRDLNAYTRDEELPF